MKRKNIIHCWKTRCKDTIHCWICEKETYLQYTVYFYDKDGKYRYGAVCPKCYKNLQKQQLKGSGTIINSVKR